MVSSLFSSPLLFGSSNSGKLSEAQVFARERGFAIVGLGDESLKSLGSPPHVPEVASSYQGNAELKGAAYSKWARRACLTDDTGIEIDLLGGFPGVFTANVGPARVREMLGAHRVVSARFTCCMVYTELSGRRVAVCGEVDGELRDLQVPEPTHRLPFSRFFYPSGSEISLESLHAKGDFEYSHRYRAFDLLLRVLS